MRHPTWSPTPRHRAELARLLSFLTPLEHMLWAAFHVNHDTFAWRR